MDCLRLEPGTLGQAFGGATRRRTECYCGGLRTEDLEDRVDQRGLADARAAGDHHHLRDERDADGLYLAVGEREFRPLFDPGDCLVGFDQWPGRLTDRQCLELRCDLAFSAVETSKKHAISPFKIVGDYGAYLKFEAECRFNQLRRHLEQLASECDELLAWKAAMAIVHRLGERVGDAGAHANKRGLLDAQLGCDLVGGAKADATDVAR